MLLAVILLPEMVSKSCPLLVKLLFFGGGIPDQDVNQTIPVPMPQTPNQVGQGAGINMPNQRQVVWQGTLEWQEKKGDNNTRVAHQVTCKMTSLVVNGEPEV